jgi:RNA polymerase sigma-70 factor (ECF subfamily)
MGSDDADLIRRWQGGDPAAFEEIVRRWQQPVGRFLFRLVGRTELVNDLCQEVFLRVYNGQARYRDNGFFSTWLYRIALNVARDAARRDRHRPARLSEQELADRTASAETLHQQEELTRTVAQCISELPKPLRVVLVLHHYEQMNFEEIARLTGTPASTLKSRFAAALRRLRTRLQQLGWGPEETER